jgi:hypothetical protein
MMNHTFDVPTVAPPSRQRLAQTTGIALAVAIAILLTIVLPAEYAIDPLGSGRWLGLTAIALPPVNPAEDMQARGAALKPNVNGPIGEYPGDFKLDVYEITLQPYEYVEYKYHLEQGATLLYAWKATAPLLHELHGEREGGAADTGPAEESFDKRDRREAAGSLTAPFKGIHGWYWENPGGTPVTVRLTSSGFYGSAVEIRSDRSRHPRTLTPIDVLASLSGDAAAAVQR